MRFLFAILLLCCLPGWARAQADTVYGYGYLPAARQDTLTTQPDATDWHRLTNHQEYAAYRNKVEFQGEKTENQNAERGTGFLAGILRFFSTVTGKVLLVSLLALLAIFLIYRWLQQQSGSPFYSSKKFQPATADQPNPEDLIQDWQAAVQQALQQEDYRMAIRFGYLWLLQILDEKQWIDYHPNKTNRDYAATIQQPAARELFLKLSRQYERAWYGPQLIQARDFEAFQQHFETLKSKATV